MYEPRVYLNVFHSHLDPNDYGVYIKASYSVVVQSGEFIPNLPIVDISINGTTSHTFKFKVHGVGEINSESNITGQALLKIHDPGVPMTENEIFTWLAGKSYDITWELWKKDANGTLVKHKSGGGVIKQGSDIEID